MAYDPHQLSAMSYANGFTIWHYRTEDSWRDIIDEEWEGRTHNYFAEAAAMFRPGDLVHVNSQAEWGPENFSVWVQSNRGGVVVVEKA